MVAAADGLRVGLLGKLPAHGDFIRRGTLPPGFCAAWDGWLQEGIATARAALGEGRWEAAWDAAPAWRFALPAGACGPEAAAGVLVPSRDTVGRRWPLTLAAVGGSADAAWPAPWFAALEGVARSVLAQGGDADALLAALPRPALADGVVAAAPPAGDDPLTGFWAAIAAESADADPAPQHDATAAGSAMHEDPAPPTQDASRMATGDDASRASPGWWTAAAADGTPGLVWPLPALPPPEDFVLLLEAGP